jgi:glycosyltransferase involved in cell wall biosynthesis
MSSNFTVVVPYYNGEEHIIKLLNSIPDGINIIVVDDMSDTPLNLDSPNCMVIRSRTKGYFTGAVNEGIKACRTDVLILNQDVWFDGISWLNFIDENSSKYAMFGERIQGNNPSHPFGYVHGTFMYMSREAINKVGLMDQVNYPLWGSTAEWQIRACRKNLPVRAFVQIPSMVHTRKGGFGSSISSLLKKEPKNKDWFIRVPPMISVVVPVHNYGRYLPDLINSFIGGPTSLGDSPGQTFQSFEIILVDDCSTDNSLEIAEKLADPRKGIFLYQTPANGGTAIARNYGISKSSAKFITSIDADDMRDYKSLQLLYEHQVKNSHSFIYDDVIIFANGKKNDKVWKMPEYDFDKLIHKNQVHCGILFPYVAWKECGGYPEQMSNGRDDWAFNVALGVKGYCGVRVNYPGYLYRREGQNRTNLNSTHKWMGVFQEKMKKIFPDIYRGVYPMSCCGGSRGISSSAGARTSPVGTNQTMVGSEGMSILVYQGLNHGNMTYYGPVTGSRYTFSASKPRKLVDKRDLRYTRDDGMKLGLLDIREHGKVMFREEKPKVVEPVKEVVSKPEPVVEEENIDIKIMEDAVTSREKISDLYDTDLAEETIEYLLETGFNSRSEIKKATNKSLREKLDWTAKDVKMLREAVK